MFRKFAKKTSYFMGSPWAFSIALSTIVVWAILGPVFNYSQIWQLSINTVTTIVTFLMVFIIQNTQNRDYKETTIKIDEIIKSMLSARNNLLDLENLTDNELKKIEESFKRLAHKRNK